MASATGVATHVIATGTDTNIDFELRSKGTGDVVLADDSGNEILVAADVASAVNEITITNAAAAASPIISATGGDTNIDVVLTPKGTGVVQLSGNLDPNGNHVTDGAGLELLRFVETGSAVNEVTVTNAATGNPPSLSATGGDTDVSLNLVPKGTGRLQVGGASGGILASVQTFTASGTWTKPSGITQVVVEVWSGGGGGARDTATPGGGGGGGYSSELLNVTGTSSETTTIGAGGTGRTSTDGDGTAGGTSSFGSLLSTTGGAAGDDAGTSSAGGAGSGGDVNLTGSNGRQVEGSVFGIGGGSPRGVQGTLGGANATTPGGGGGGGSSVGGNGGAGLIIVWEYA